MAVLTTESAENAQSDTERKVVRIVEKNQLI